MKDIDDGMNDLYYLLTMYNVASKERSTKWNDKERLTKSSEGISKQKFSGNNSQLSAIFPISHFF